MVGRSVRLTAYVRSLGSDSVPTGAVVFSADDVVLGNATVHGGTAVLVTLDLGIGDHTLSAAYDGDDAHLPSRSAPNLTAGRAKVGEPSASNPDGRRFPPART